MSDIIYPTPQFPDKMRTMGKTYLTKSWSGSKGLTYVKEKLTARLGNHPAKTQTQHFPAPLLGDSGLFSLSHDSETGAGNQIYQGTHLWVITSSPNSAHL